MHHLLNKIASSNFLIKVKSWEYWPFGILQFPLFFYFAWLAIRARSLVFFSAANPGIEMGGMFGESKYEIIKKLPTLIAPETILIKQPTTAEAVGEVLLQRGFRYPVIFKPDIGERGFMVKKISGPPDIQAYLGSMSSDFLIQEYISLPLEFGVFYSRLPSQVRGKIVSIVMKEMLFVAGDGKSSLKDLILRKDRAKLQWTKLKNLYRDRLDEVLAQGEKIELVSIGNHALGTKFLNGNHLITEKLTESFDKISKQIPGFYFGRFDIRCESLTHLENGEVKVLELNGCGAEPAHIYDPDFKLKEAILVLFRHWRMIFEIARENNNRGVEYFTLKEGLAYYRKFKAATKQA